MATYVITGADSGLGFEICSLLSGGRHNFVIGISKDPIQHGNCNFAIQCDLRDPLQIAEACQTIRSLGGIEYLINCAGINEINWLEDLGLKQWDDTLNVNARAIYLMTKGLLPALIASKGTVLNIISNASHMPMTASLAYNASKGAAHIMTLQLARELTKRYGITVFGISPNKMSGTAMSKYIESRVPEVRGWTAEEAARYQHAALLAGEETDPKVLAEFIAFLLYDKRNHKYLTGCIIPYGA